MRLSLRFRRLLFSLSAASLLAALPPLAAQTETSATPPAATEAAPALPTDSSSTSPLVDPAAPGAPAIPPAPLTDLAPAAFASPDSNWERLEDQAGWLADSQQDTIIRALDKFAEVNGVSLYIATAPSGQGPIVLNQARVALDAEFNSAPVAIYVLSNDPKVPMVYLGSDRLKEHMGEEKFFTMNARAREAVTKETKTGARLAALFTTLSNSGLAEIKAKAPALPAAEALPDTAEAPVATTSAPVVAPATEAAPPIVAAETTPAPAPSPEPAPIAPVAEAAPAITIAPSAEAAPSPAAEAAPSAPSKAAAPDSAPAPEAKSATEPRPYLWVTIACLAALVIVGGGAWFLLNLYRPVEVTPRAADRVQEQKRQQAAVRNRVNGEKVGVGALMNNITTALTQTKPPGTASESGNRRANGAPAPGASNGRRTEVAAPKPEGANARRAPGETFEQRLWRCFGDYSRMHYGRRPESFTAEQVTEAQQHELFAVLDEYLTYFKWLSSQANGRDDKKSAKLADERYQFLYGASNLLKRSAPTLRNHLMGGLETFLRECAEEGTVPGVTKPRRTAGVS